MTAPPDSPRDRAADFVRLYSAHSRRVYTYLLTLLPNREDAAEVFQDVSMLLWTKFDDFQPDTNFAAWACKVAQLRARKFRERSARRAQLFSSELFELIETEMQVTEDSLQTEYRALAECFAQLAAADRELIERRYRAGGNPRRLSTEMCWPIKRIYSELRRIRRALMACVTRRLATGDDS